MPICSNGADANSSGKYPGFSISLINSDGEGQIAISNNTNNCIGLNSAVITPRVWQYIALVWNVESKSAGLYVLAKTASATKASVTLDASTLSGSILTADGCTWAFNTRGTLTLALTPTKDINDFIYDDIAVFAGCLTADDINLIVASQAPMSKIMDLLSIQPAHYYPFENEAKPINLAPNGFGDVLSGSATNRLLTSENVSHNTTAATGCYGNGLATYSEPNSHAYFHPDSDVAKLLKGDQSFTLGFWIYCPEYCGNYMPICSNGADANSSGKYPGFSISLINGSGEGQIEISNNTNGCVGSNSAVITPRVWQYIALVWNVEHKSAGLYVLAKTASATKASVTLDASTLSGSILTADGCTWAFNTRGTLTLAVTPKKDVNDFIYDDIAVFAGCLTTKDINLIVASQAPLSEIMDSLSILPSHYYPLDSGGLENLSDWRMDHINRMVRLQRWLDLPYEQVDLLLSTCIRAQGINNIDFSSNTHTLRMLGVFRHFQKKYQITAYQFSAVVNQITPYAISPNIPFFDQIFNSPSLTETPFVITEGNFNYPPTTPADELIVKQLCAGLGISEAQFGVLASHVMTQQGDSTNKTLPCSLSVVSAFYRLAMLPRWMGLSFAEGAALFSLLADGQMVWNTLACLPVLAELDGTSHLPTTSDILDVLMALDSAVDWAKNHKQSWIKNYLVLQDTLTHPVPTTDILNVVTSINQQVPTAVLTEADFDSTGVPAIDVLSLNGYTQINGEVTKTGYQLDSKYKQYASLNGYPNTLTNGSTSYSIGCWVLITSGLTTSVPLMANSDYNKQGIFISIKANDNIGVTIYDSTGKGVSSTSEILYPADTWFYLTLTLDFEEKLLLST
jgi:hypothetical protein